MPPTPKRSTERRRRNVYPGEEKVEVAGSVVVPELPGDLHEVARSWYASLAQSGQSEFYEPSDWQDAVIAARVLSDYMSGAVQTAAILSEWRQMADRLMTTEVARRKSRIEVERALASPKPSPGLSAMEDYRQRLAK